ncbi:MAG: FliI/YscN family ATPase [Ilumatobacteraceae bacterium]|nr:FliI/YscN family ATPase [Ilumatobacteraceae bacterium]
MTGPTGQGAANPTSTATSPTQIGSPSRPTTVSWTSPRDRASKWAAGGDTQPADDHAHPDGTDPHDVEPGGLPIALPIRGTVAVIRGMEVGVRGIRLPMGTAVSVDAMGGTLDAEVVAASDGEVRLAMLGEPLGLACGDMARPTLASGQPMGSGVLGRVVDALGHPIDGKGPVNAARGLIDRPVPPALTRRRITEPMPVGVRVLDAFTTLAKGQRVGLFAGSGVGKSTLLGMIARGAEADCVVICLVGERGREVREFLEDDLGPDAASRAAVVVATSDQPALVRVRALRYATAIAEQLADEGRDVLFLCDSLTRFALAQREVGLAAGEPPTARGFTPSVFAALPRLLERTGPRENGTITAIYTVLVDGDDHNDPIADTVRGILDGHIVLDRRLAHAGRYPAVDPLMSISRLASKVLDPAKVAIADRARRALSAAEAVRDLVEVGAYAPGSNLEADEGLEMSPALIELCRQRIDEISSLDDTFTGLAAIAAEVDRAHGARP